MRRWYVVGYRDFPIHTVVLSILKSEPIDDGDSSWLVEARDDFDFLARHLYGVKKVEIVEGEERAA